MDITPITQTISKLLSSGDQFEIPRYQREYSWKDNNFREFIDDILKNLSINNNQISTSDYFLGTMLMAKNPRSEKKLEVVDGQQRLTTITILFSALSEHFKTLGKEDLRNGIFEYIIKEDNDERRYSVLCNSNYYLSHYVQFFDKKEAYNETASDEDKCVQKAYNYFLKRTKEKELRKSLQEFCGKPVNGISYEAMLKAIQDQVSRSLVVVITTEKSKDINKIFEILNAKGKPLASVDLIKNEIFALCDDTASADTTKEKWTETKANLYDKGNKTDMATFFRHYWISKYSYVSENKLFKAFKETIEPKKDTYESFLQDLVKNSNYYIRIVSPDRAHYRNRQEYFGVVQALKFMSQDFKIVQIRIILMAAFEMKEKEMISNKMFVKLVQFLEGFHFIYNTMLARSTNVLEKRYGDFARELRNRKQSKDANECINNWINNFDLYPSYDDFKQAFMQLTYTSLNSKKNESNNMKVKFILKKLYCYYEGLEVFDDYATIEHIMPEKDKNKGDVLNIGNLIVLPQNENNGDCGDKPYKEKREIYLTSKYKWVKDFAESHADWTGDEIPKRAEEMAKDSYDMFRYLLKKKQNNQKQ